MINNIKKIKVISVLLVLLLLMTACSNKTANGDDESSTDSGDTEASGIVGTPVDADFSATDADMFTDRDYEVGYDESSAVVIELNGTSVSCSSNAVEIAGTTVTIKDEGTYIISGTLSDGMIVVDAEESDKAQLVFNGVSIISKTSAPLYILEAAKVFVTLADGTENILENGGTFEAIDENNIDAAVFSKQDITFNGSGTLTVTSPAGHGIVCKDDLVFTSGTYVVNSSSHGLDANDSVRIANASITVDAGKDGIHSENSDDATLGFIYISSGTLNIEAEGDGISAYVSIQIEGGTIDVLAGGGYENGTSSSSDNYGGFMGGGRPGQQSSSTTDTTEESTSMKGIKATGSILLSDGKFNIDSADDGVHADGSVIINGGTFNIASGDDGIHAEEDLSVAAGTIIISESYEGLEALNIEVSGGDINLVASDDGLNAAGGTDASGTTGGRDGMFGGGHGGMSSSSNGSVVISGGNLHINSSGDGIDANGTLEICGGYTVVVGPTQGDTATLDYDVSGVITGGTFIGTGASGMAQTFSDSENQGVIAVSVGSQSAGTEITLKNSDGETIITYSPELSFAVVILSSPDIISGKTYTISVGSTSGDFEAS